MSRSTDEETLNPEQKSLHQQESDSQSPAAGVQNKDVNLLQLTDAAAYKIYELIEEEQNPDLKLRIYIEGGGCSGFQYGFQFEDTPEEDDSIIKKKITWPQVLKKSAASLLNQPEQNIAKKTAPTAGQSSTASATTPTEVTVSVLVDPLSLQYLRGAEVDYREDE